MVTISELFLLDLGTFMRLDIMAWVLGVPVVIVAVVLLVVQQRQSRRLQEDLKQLSKKYQAFFKRLTIVHFQLVVSAIFNCCVSPASVVFMAFFPCFYLLEALFELCFDALCRRLVICASRQ